MAAVAGERLGIVGAGTIACGLAACAARHGEVTLVARSDASAERAERSVAKVCSKFADQLPPERVRITTDIEAGLADRTFVVEAIAEKLDAKRELFARLEGRLGDDAVLGSTTSSLCVSTLAAASGRPERFVGFHVFNPVARMELIELAFPEAAAPTTRERAHALAALLEKRAVEVPDQAGFVVNRLLFPFLFDAVRFAEEHDMAPDRRRCVHDARRRPSDGAAGAAGLRRARRVGRDRRVARGRGAREGARARRRGRGRQEGRARLLYVRLTRSRRG